MPKRIFWPAAFITMGLIVIASIMGYLPREFTMFWPIILVVVGLGGLVTADREDWLVFGNAPTPIKKTKVIEKATKKKSTKKTARRR